MCLDMGHANLHLGTRNNYVRFVDRLGDHVPIIQWHVHDNWGGPRYLKFFNRIRHHQGLEYEAPWDVYRGKVQVKGPAPRT